MVGAAAELPSVQMHGPVGLGRGGEHGSDITQMNWGQAPSHPWGQEAPHCQVQDATTDPRTQQGWARPGREGSAATESLKGDGSGLAHSSEHASPLSF